MRGVDRFLNIVFGFSKVVSAGIVAMCCLALVILSFSLLSSWSVSFDVPRFDVVKEIYEASQTQSAQTSASEYKGLEERRRIEKEFGDEIQRIIKEFGLSASSYDVLVSDLRGIPENLRATYLDGLKDFLKEVRKFGKKRDDFRLSSAEAANIYRQLFFEELQSLRLKKEASSQKRIQTLVAMGVVFVVLLAFLVIPLLVKIEENTRPRSETCEKGQEMNNPFKGLKDHLRAVGPTKFFKKKE